MVETTGLLSPHTLKTELFIFRSLRSVHVLLSQRRSRYHIVDAKSPNSNTCTNILRRRNHIKQFTLLHVPVLLIASTSAVTVKIGGHFVVLAVYNRKFKLSFYFTMQKILQKRAGNFKLFPATKRRE